MALEQRQYQVQTEAQLLKLSPLQLMTTKLLELPIVELEQRVKDEAIDNITLETGVAPDHEGEEYDDERKAADSEGEIYDDEREAPNPEGEEYSEYSDESGNNSNYDDQYDSDELPVYSQNGSGEDKQEYVIGETVSFVDSLMEQLVDFDLTAHQRTLVEYLINSLNDNGFIENPLYRIADEMLFQHNIETTEEELEEALKVLQQFDPAGIGARDTRECLLLQIDRKMNDKEHLLGDKYFLLEEGRTIVADHYELFVNNNTEKLSRLLNISPARLKLIFDELKKLNLHPGLALTESARDRVSTAVPDFIVETDENGQISCRLNNGELPTMRINREYVNQLKAYEQTERKLSRSEQDFVTYTRNKIDSAKLFIEAVRQRNNTLLKTMNAIIALQKQFFLTQDPDDLQPLILKDVAEKAGFDISTVSRVRNSKYCMIDGHIYPLTFFFKQSRINAQGETLDADKTKSAIKQLIETEDKTAPLADGQIAELLSKQGINIKRRTVAKYRDEMGIPPVQKRLSL